ncbi:hypothetical protein [Lentilactobacillus sp. SPB1-3]|uniref:Uncharacterized protein n=1 Tax=Lentilactobacillus terminaliae TaxID=3003483 RepID=A0ACD5DCQ8_9LACO|nr:hypothetical protein [Lentilactobacillus sp. SPB1-3]MCZ0978144.1 hypothetical protein [Lentilactobacillus sp. SPB1-3]
MSKLKDNGKSPREYIYLDTVEMNSLLAQFEDGIPQLIKNVQQTTTSTLESSTKQKHHEESAGLNSNKASMGRSAMETGSETNGKMNQLAIDTVYNDFAVDLVEKELEDAELLKVTSKQSEGSIVKLKQPFSLLDFKSLSEITRNKSAIHLMKLADDFDDSWVEGFDSFKKSTDFLNSLFPDTVMFKLKSSLVFAETSNLRMNLTQLQMLALSTRKITVLGEVESIIESDDSAAYQHSDENNITDAMQYLLPGLSVNILSTFTGIKKDDRLIKPIAIYFE